MRFGPRRLSSRLILASEIHTPLLQVEDLSAAYSGVAAFRGVSLFVRSSEMVTLIGANGSGKTSLLRTIAGVIKPSAGQIYFGGSPISHLPPHEIARRGIAWVQEGRAILTRITVEENLKVGAYSRTDKKAIRSDLLWMFGKFPVLQERRSQWAGTLSGGEQQMLAIARALMSRPKLILLDEPSLGLAPLMIRGVYEIISDLQQSGITILLVEQNARIALKVATRAYLMETGRIVSDGPTRQLATDPKVQQAYLGGTWQETLDRQRSL